MYICIVLAAISPACAYVYMYSLHLCYGLVLVPNPNPNPNPNSNPITNLTWTAIKLYLLGLAVFNRDCLHDGRELHACNTWVGSTAIRSTKPLYCYYTLYRCQVQWSARHMIWSICCGTSCQLASLLAQHATLLVCKSAFVSLNTYTFIW